ncbi:MAG: NADH-quinone oxidoreductase subunit J [Fimbriimonadia bacterium]|nr:NADH-quinone oxidoreductase subunit J [Fimbriimonadia bacterium]
MGERIFFFLLAAIIIMASITVVASKNPVRSALALVVNFFALAMLYITLHAHFLGAVQIIVYAGAIMVLFLFVIMLLNLGSPDAMQETTEIKRPIAWVIGLSILGLMMTQVFMVASVVPTEAPEWIGTTENVGNALFSKWAFPFEITSILLLVAVIGSILLAKRRQLN